MGAGRWHSSMGCVIAPFCIKQQLSDASLSDCNISALISCIEQ